MTKGTISRQQHDRIAAEILGGRERAHTKHGENSIEAIDHADPRWLSILIEEVGELAHEQTYDAGGTIDSVRAELVDVATVAIAWIASIDAATAQFEASRDPDVSGAGS